MSWIALGTICLSLSHSLSFWWCWCMSVVSISLHFGKKVLCFHWQRVVDNMPAMTEITSDFKRDAGKTWLTQQRLKTTETNTLLRFSDLSGFSFKIWWLSNLLCIYWAIQKYCILWLSSPAWLSLIEAYICAMCALLLWKFLKPHIEYFCICC